MATVGSYRDLGPSLAQHLQGNQSMPLRSQFPINAEGPPSGRKEGPRFNTGLAVGLDLDSEKALKKQKQAEYRQQLDSEKNKPSNLEPQQQMYRHAPSGERLTYPSHHSPVGPQSTHQPISSSRLTPRGNIKEKVEDYPPFGSSGVDKNDRRQRQEEYKRELDKQMKEKTADSQKERDGDQRTSYMNSMASANENRQNSRNGRQELYQHQPLQRQFSNDRNDYRRDIPPDNRMQGDEQYGRHDNDPQYQEYLRQISKNNQPVLTNSSMPMNSAYNGSQRSENPPRSQG